MSIVSSRLAAAALALGAAALAPQAARAQYATPAGAAPRSTVSIGASAGLALPSGDVGQWLGSGYDVSVHLALRPAASPLGLRLEGMYGALPYNDASGIGGSTHRVVAGIVNGTYDLGSGPGGNLYLIGGAGIYGTSDKASYAGQFPDADRTYTNLGVNGGVGYRFPLGDMSAFAEARYHHITGTNSATGGSEQLIPITVGISF